MKPLTQYIELRYISEAIKPPRLSAKNKEIWANNKPLDEKKVWEWLKNNITIADKRKVEIMGSKINVDGNVNVRDCVEEFPYPFGEVTGFFDCYGCGRLKSLKNSPQKVGGYFDCSDCESLTSLEGAPEEVGNFFGCSKCKSLTSLEGAPKEVDGDFWCFNCGKEFTEDDVKKVCNVRGWISV